MNTLRTQGYIQQTSARDHVILLGDLEFSMPKEQLKEITELHNDGTRYEEIAEIVKRNKFEVLLALIHQAKKGFHMKPLAFRK